MRLDAHQHFWNYSSEEYGWISEEMGAIRQSFLPPDLQPLLQENGFDGTVAVQARSTEEETRWLLELADQYPLIKGVVGWVDLLAPDVEQVLAKFAAHPKFVGVRHIVQGEPQDDFVLRDEFRHGIAALRKFGLTYDLLTLPRHLPYATRLVAEFPEQPFVLDHISKPYIKQGIVGEWADDIKALAAHPNVHCKLSGMVTEADWERNEPHHFTPYLDIVFEAFGADRLMIGSDWPVCLVSRPYKETMNIVKNYISGMDAKVQQQILGGNCAAFYGIVH